MMTGKHSYIGQSIVQYGSKKHRYDAFSLRDPHWQDVSWEGYDVVCHVAGKAHVSYRQAHASEYFEVNRDLALQVAQKAKAEGIKQFILFSTLLVYGESSVKHKVFNASTSCHPTSPYAQSKWQAEQAITELQTDTFKVVILRLPMIYGPDSKGNYPRLVQLALRLPVFPKVNNQRSMLYIEDLIRFIIHLIDAQEAGLFVPQNAHVVSISQLVQTIRKVHHKKTWLVPGLSPLIHVMMPFSSSMRKMFGTFVYDTNDSIYAFDYQKTPFDESIKLSERG